MASLSPDEVSIVRLAVGLEPDERLRYQQLTGSFLELRGRTFRSGRARSHEELLREIGRTPHGRAALRDYAVAVRIASFPRAKRELVTALLERHRADRTIVFTAHVDDAYALAERELIAVLASDVAPRERERVVSKIKEGRLRAVALARLSVDVSESLGARVAIVASGTLGQRECGQRVRRLLRPPSGERAIVYELVTIATVDERVRAAEEGRDAPLA